MKHKIILLGLLISASSFAYTGKIIQVKQSVNNSTQKTGIAFLSGGEQYQVLIDTYVPAKKSLFSQKASNSNVAKYVYNPRTGNTAILTGDIKVKLKQGADVSLLAEQYSLTIKANYPHLGRVFFSVSEGQDIVQITADLVQNILVESAQIDVKEYFFKPL